MTTCARAGWCADCNYPFLTLKERDIETELDYFLARYYSSTQGRFTSPDEFSGGPDDLYDFTEAASENPTFYADLTNPQSLNKYQYTYNNPVNLVDPDGHWPDLSGFVVPSPKVTIAIISNPLDSLQAAISVVGLVPGAGEAADIANAGISVARGNYGDAALDLAGAAGPVGSGVAIGNRVRKIARAASKVEDAIDGAKATSKTTEGVYEFADAANDGKTYVGQSGNIPARLKQHERSGRLAPTDKPKTRTVTGGKAKRELAEQKRIDRLGGTRKVPGSKTSNIRNPVSEQRKKKISEAQ